MQTPAPLHLTSLHPTPRQSYPTPLHHTLQSKTNFSASPRPPRHAQVYYAQPGGREPLLLACEESKPSYQRLEELMAPIFARWVGRRAGALL